MVCPPRGGALGIVVTRIRLALHNSFLSFYYASNMVFTLTGLHRVLINPQTLVSTCCLPGIIPGKAIIIVIAFERTRSYISYFLCLSLKQRVPRFVAGAACSSADASQTGCCSGHTPVPAGPAEGPAGPGAVSSASVGPEGAPLAMLPGFLLPCGAGPFPFVPRAPPKGKETPSGNPEDAECVRHTTLASSVDAGIEGGPRAVYPPPSLPPLHFSLSARCVGWAGPGFCWNRGAVGWNM